MGPLQSSNREATPILWRAWRVAVFLAVAGVGCHTGFDVFEPSIRAIDQSPAWSPDGKEVAYYREVSSSYGPPGVYLIDLETRVNRLIHSGQFQAPDLRFSPKKRHLALTNARQISLIDINSGYLKAITNRNIRAMLEDWSPDGQRILYTRGSELWILHLESNQDGPLLHDGEIVEGRHARWSPAGEPIAFMHDGDIYTIRSDGTEWRRLTHNAEPVSAWYPRWVLGGAYLVYSSISHGGGSETRIMTPDGSRDGRVPFIIQPSEAISPSFLETIVHGPLPEDQQSFVLFVRTLADPRNTTLRQLTFYEP